MSIHAGSTTGQVFPYLAQGFKELLYESYILSEQMGHSTVRKYKTTFTSINFHEWKKMKLNTNFPEPAISSLDIMSASLGYLPTEPNIFINKNLILQLSNPSNP